MMRSPIEKQMVEICPFRIGQRVEVSPKCKYADEWRGVYVIVGMRWEYQRSAEINIEIASDEDIQRSYGSTDGFRPADLVHAQPK